MSQTTPCKQIKDCIQFQDFVPSSPNDTLFTNPGSTVTVTCPNGSQVTVDVPAGVVGYVLKFAIGDPPYPDLTLNCTGGLISIPVPDTTTADGLNALVNDLISQCVNQLARSIGCSTGTFFNTQQSVSCNGGSGTVTLVGALPPGVTVSGPGVGNTLNMAAGVIQSTASVADANAKALLVLNEILATGNATCS